MNAYPTSTSYSNYSYPVGQVSDVAYGNDTYIQQYRNHYTGQQEMRDVFYHDSHNQSNRNAYQINNTYHHGNPSSFQQTNVDRGGRDYSYPAPPPVSTKAPIAYSRHPGGGVAPLVDVRNAHIPPLPTINSRSNISYTGYIYPTGHGGGYEKPKSHGHGHAHGDQLVKRNRSSSSSSIHSSPYRPRRSSQSSNTFTGPAARPTRKVVYNDARCVMKNSHGAPLGPTNHVIVPQPSFFDDSQMANLESFRHESVSFQLGQFPELGVRLSEALGRHHPILIGGNDTPFENDVYKEIKLKIVWPGYSKFTYERRIKTRNAQTSRTTILILLSAAIADWIKHVDHNNIPVEPGYERWQVGSRKPLITPSELFVTGLIHRGGANWQPEIWCPSHRAN